MTSTPANPNTEESPQYTLGTKPYAGSPLDLYIGLPSARRRILRAGGGSTRFPRLTSGREVLTGKPARRGVPGAHGSAHWSA